MVSLHLFLDFLAYFPIFLIYPIISMRYVRENFSGA